MGQSALTKPHCEELGLTQRGPQPLLLVPLTLILYLSLESVAICSSLELSPLQDGEQGGQLLDSEPQGGGAKTLNPFISLSLHRVKAKGQGRPCS